MPTPRRKAAALRYGKDAGASAPLVVAAGQGLVADAIVAAAREAGVPIHEDRLLAEALAALELGGEIPPELYQAVAETLVWAYGLAR
ncbi:MAG: flagellar biosynthesis protein [Gaiellales bacterium]|nr:flagellar biosynthesis protein [Gaiellales bacterium]MDX6599170.1 flagellar biosynthesis protein [Gaiellales bacterium]